jgi:Arc/MetJ-type ribon-helix-helix transcriptional regulator
MRRATRAVHSPVGARDDQAPQPERRVLDTLVEAGVARSRSDALAWSVRLVGQHAEAWLSELRAAMEQVERVRAQGPQTEQDDQR